MINSIFLKRLFVNRWQRKLKVFRRLVNLEDRESHIKHHSFLDQKFFSGSTKCLAQNHQKLPFNTADFPAEKIRNFSIIAHVDHGKSTLADRLLEISGTIPEGNNQQVLDRLQVERERGITVKAQTASLVVQKDGEDYLLNLIDTPGHVDFHYEVSRSLAACQGVILLVDANQGVQAQTVANFFLAFEADLTILPVMNKIDLPNAQPDIVADQINNIFDIDLEQILQVSAKQGTGVSELIQEIIERVPSPQYDREAPLKAFVFDSWYDQYKGVVAHVAVCGGVMRKGDKITCASSGKTYDVTEIGVMYPLQVPSDGLFAGQVGYAMMAMRNTSEAKIGDTFYHEKKPVEPLPGFKEATPMVFAGVFPSDSTDFVAMRNAIDKLTLNDRSVDVKKDNSPALGQGYRLGFLGLLHMDVFNQRLQQEFDANVIVTAPNVAYKMKIRGEKNIKQHHGDEILVLNPCLMPSPDIIVEYQEPMVKSTIITPDHFIEAITDLCLKRRGHLKDQSYIDNKRIMLQVRFPLSEILVEFFDDLKSLSSGYASFDYEDDGYEISDLLKLTFTLNGLEVDELTMICHTARARDIARQVCVKLKENLPRQQFAIAVQCKVNRKVIAREDIKAFRKDVTAKCYGGDQQRKKKLLKQQAEGKKKMRKIGNIDIPKDAFIKILKK